LSHPVQEQADETLLQDGTCMTTYKYDDDDDDDDDYYYYYYYYHHHHHHHHLY